MTFTLEEPDGTTVGDAFDADLAPVAVAELAALTESLGDRPTHVLCAEPAEGLASGRFAVDPDGARYLLLSNLMLPRFFPAGEVRWHVKQEGVG
jgi:hypothetical protein